MANIPYYTKSILKGVKGPSFRDLLRKYINTGYQAYSGNAHNTNQVDKEGFEEFCKMLYEDWYYEGLKRKDINNDLKLQVEYFKHDKKFDPKNIEQSGGDTPFYDVIYNMENDIPKEYSKDFLFLTPFENQGEKLVTKDGRANEGFLHVYGYRNLAQHRDDIDSRLYLNLKGENISKFAIEAYKECKKQNLPFYFKFGLSDDRNDPFLFYCSHEKLYLYLEVIKTIKEKKPELFEGTEKVSPNMGIIDGYIGKPSFTKPNRTYQTVIINGRYVTSPLINAALSRVYEDYMLKRAYPFYVLNIQMPPEMVDVNVHPNKKEVKFQDSQQIFGFVLHTVDDALIESRNNINENEPSRLKADEIFSKNNSYNDEQKCALSDENNTHSDDKTGVSDDFIQKDTDLINLENSINALSNITFMQNFNTTPNISESSNDVMSEIILDKLNNISQLGQPLEPDKKEIEKFQPKPILNQFMFKNIEGDLSRQEVKIVGKIFNTFIIVEVSEKVYIIDQHAAHERMLYDSLLLSLKKVETCAQPLLLPYMLEVNNKEKQFILDNLENIEKLGFEIELFGNNSFKISTIPYNLPDLQISEFFSKVLQDMDTILNLKDKDLVLEHLAQTACKHAVKGGDDLKDEEIWALLSKVATQGVQLQCPHGRPFVIELKRSDVDKWFKRIV